MLKSAQLDQKQTTLPRHRKPRRLAVVAAAVVVLACGLALHQTLSFASSTLDYGLNLIQRYYLFDAELDNEKLLGDSLQYLENRVPELTSDTEDDQSYTLRVGSCTLRVEAPPGPDLSALAEPLAKVAVLTERCVKELPEGLESLENVLLSGVLYGLDPYSTLFNAKKHTEHTIQFRGKLAGIGARVGIREDELTLIKVYEDSPAYKAGLRDGDVVQRIGPMSAANITVTDAVARIRGPVGTKIALAVRSEGSDKTHVETVTRGMVTIPSVTVELLPNDVLYAEISHFSQSTPNDFRDEVLSVVEANPGLRGLVIDLRRNSGGSMLGASSIGDLFLEEGMLITTAGRKGKPVSGLRAEIAAGEDAPLLDMPVAFLTSPRTASGSELLAAALRNNDRAIVVGERSYGKGTVQKTYRMNEGAAIKLTVGRFLPNKLPIPGGGLVPDVELREIELHDKGTLLRGYRDLDDLPFWLRTPTWSAAPVRKPAAVISIARTVTDEELDNPDHENEKVDRPDPARELAVAILRGYGSRSGSEMIASARHFLDLKGRQADIEVEQFLGRQGIDWSRGSRPAGEAVLETEVATSGGKLNPGEENTVTVTVTNRGDAPLFRLRAVSDSAATGLGAWGFLFGHIEPGESRSASFKTKLPISLRTSRRQVELRYFDDDGLLSKAGPAYLAVESTSRPSLAWRTRVVQPDEESRTDIVVEIENRGQGATGKLRVFVKNPLGEDFEPLDIMHPLDPLAPGEKREIRLGLRRVIETVDIPTATVVVSDADFEVFMETEVPLSTDTATSRWRQAPTVKLEIARKADDSGDYRVLARATDDSGLSLVIATLDGDQVDYVEASESTTPMKDISLKLMWNPDKGVRNYNIRAVDHDGLITVYHAAL